MTTMHIVDLCGHFLCMGEATHDVHVQLGRGHVIHLCETHAKELEERAKADGVSNLIELRRRGS